MLCKQSSASTQPQLTMARTVAALSLGVLLLLFATPSSPGGSGIITGAAAARLPQQQVERHRAANAAPWFCHGLDCPPYTLVKQISNDVEVRQYDGGECECVRRGCTSCMPVVGVR